MLQFTSRIKKEIDARIEQIECSEISMINKSLEASGILTEAFNQLKEFILSYDFKNEEEEIFFFKEAKPRLCSRLIYYHKIYNIEMNRPAGIEKQREYLRIALIPPKPEYLASISRSSGVACRCSLSRLNANLIASMF